MEVFPQFNLFPRIRKAADFVKHIIFNCNVPLSESDHYIREHFTDAPVQPPQGLPPAQPWNQER